MTPNEKELLEAVSELSDAVNDLYFHLSAESRDAEEGAAEGLLARADLLDACGQSLASARSRLRRLGADCLK